MLYTEPLGWMNCLRSNSRIVGSHHVKKCIQACTKCADSHHHANAQGLKPGLWSPLIHSIVSRKHVYIILTPQTPFTTYVSLRNKKNVIWISYLMWSYGYRLIWAFSVQIWATTWENVPCYTCPVKIQISLWRLIWVLTGHIWAAREKCARVCAKCADSHLAADVQGFIRVFILHWNSLQKPMILSADSERPDSTMPLCRHIWAFLVR